MPRRSSTTEPKSKPVFNFGNQYPCDCGAYFEQTGAAWVYLRGSFAGSLEEGAKDRAERPRNWTIMLQMACSCGARAYVATEDATSTKTGRRVSRGEVIPTERVPIETVPIHERRGDPLLAFHGNKDRHAEYQKARAELVRQIVRRHLKPKAVADRLVDLADRFPEKAAVLVSEAGAIAAAMPPQELQEAASVAG